MNHFWHRLSHIPASSDGPLGVSATVLESSGMFNRYSPYFFFFFFSENLM
jgi:hypothetical protein